MSITLALDTSTIVCAGVAQDQLALAGLSVGDQTSHAELLADSVAAVLSQAGLTFDEVSEVIVGVGPGPFTGLRVGIATARTLAWTRGITPKGVCSLDVLALQWKLSNTPPTSDFVIATNARRKELYWARYGASGERVGEPQVSDPQLLPALPTGGPGANLYPIPGEFAADAPVELAAAIMAAHGKELPDVGIEPLYLRKPDAELPRTRKSTLTSTRLTLPNRAGRP